MHSLRCSRRDASRLSSNISWLRRATLPLSVEIHEPRLGLAPFVVKSVELLLRG